MFSVFVINIITITVIIIIIIIIIIVIIIYLKVVPVKWESFFSCKVIKSRERGRRRRKKPSGERHKCSLKLS